MPKIPALPPMTSPDGADELPIEDVSVGNTKYVTLTRLKEWLQSLTGWITTAMIGDTQITRAKIDTASYAIMRLRASTNTSLSTSAVTINLATVDLSVGTGLTQSGSGIVIGSGISRVRVSAVCIADSMSNDTYLFTRLRRNRGGSLSEFTSQLNRMTSGFVSTSHPPYVLEVQSGDIIDFRADIGAGSGTISSGRPQWLQVEVIG